ncbi:hypothetical protein [Candidatus Methylacidithermus pantelleriae]|uniref:Uncharacterized protein n=1 Tax=Candidatus Methylacidithermus pantelleriae TaxID=2744239 RepID=A0A8J2FRP1_9BACT|nr:hypothetical protein [Candidatus Methylacidithermus pantelleriae]CAF0689629.1 conserved hypothetical protein [Candidatus Methylacidithermus pantelleriae]
MGLRSFHLVFISLSSLLLVGFGAWCLGYFPTLREAIYLWIGSLSVVLGLGIAAYGAWFYVKTKRLRITE